MRPVHILSLGLFLAGSLSAQESGYTEIGPQSIDLRNGGVAAKADWLRYKLVEVNGPTGGYILAQGHGDQAGYVGTINRLTGGGALGGLLSQEGITNCSAIPTRGNASGPVTIEEGPGERASFDAVAYFGRGNRPLPAHFDGAGELFDKLIVVSLDDRPSLEIQLSCTQDSALVSGYFWLPANDFNDRPREVYFQRNTATGLSRVDFYMIHAPSGEHYAFRFETENGQIARIWNIRAIVGGSDTSSGFAATYRPHSGVAITSFLHSTSDATSLADGELECLDLTTNAGSSACEEQGLAVTDPLASATIGTAGVPFNVAGMSGMSLRVGLPEIPPVGDEPADDPDAGPMDANDGPVDSDGGF